MAQQQDSGQRAGMFQVTTSTAAALQFFTDSEDKITGHSVSIALPEVSLHYKRWIVSLSSAYGAATSSVNMRLDNTRFIARDEHFGVLQFKALAGYMALKKRAISIAPLIGIGACSLQRKQDAKAVGGVGSLSLFPNYVVAAAVNYNINNRRIAAANRTSVRHFLTLTVCYSFLNLSGAVNMHGAILNLPQRLKEIEIGWGVFLVR